MIGEIRGSFFLPSFASLSICLLLLRYLHFATIIHIIHITRIMMLVFTRFSVTLSLATVVVVLLTFSFTYLQLLDISNTAYVAQPQQYQSPVLSQSIDQDFINEQLAKPYLPEVDELYSLTPVREAPKTITTTVFMFRGDFSSDLYDLFSLQKRAVRYCDRNTTVEGCSVKLPRNYKWNILSFKLLDSLEHMCKAPKKTDFYVKIDDDLIMSESKLDEAIRLMAATDCQVAGGIALDYGFYWAVGQIYIFKRQILEQICSQLPIPRLFHAHEDIAFGSMLNSTDKSMFCNILTPQNHWHKSYSDRRINNNYLEQHNY